MSAWEITMEKRNKLERLEDRIELLLASIPAKKLQKDITILYELTHEYKEITGNYYVRKKYRK